MPGLRIGLLALASSTLAGCTRTRTSDGARLARANCSVCHAFPEPALLDKKTWQDGVLPQMAIRVGARMATSPRAAFTNPYMLVLPRAVPQADFDKIAAYYRDSAPDKLPDQSLPATPQLDPSFFQVKPMVDRLASSAR